MKKIFEPVRIGNMEMKNRLVRSAILEICDRRDGSISPMAHDIYAELVKGEIGLVITGMMGVSENSRMVPMMVDTRAPGFVAELKELTDKIHAMGGKIAVQLSHCGVKAGVLESSEVPVGPSESPLRAGGVSHALTVEEIQGIVKDFGAAAAKCKEGGADAVQIQAAHGWLISQFISPYFNKREDCYGGSLENRARILMETYAEVRSCVGDDYPVMVKINAEDLVEGCLTKEESLEICKMLDEAGIDAFEVSSGIAVNRDSAASGRPREDGHGTFEDGAQMIAAAVKAPVFSVCGYRSLENAENALNAGNLAGISLARPLIRQPDLAALWKSGAVTGCDCISCSQCFKGAFGCKAK